MLFRLLIFRKFLHLWIPLQPELASHLTVQALIHTVFKNIVLETWTLSFLRRRLNSLLTSLLEFYSFVFSLLVYILDQVHETLSVGPNSFESTILKIFFFFLRMYFYNFDFFAFRMPFRNVPHTGHSYHSAITRRIMPVSCLLVSSFDLENPKYGKPSILNLFSLFSNLMVIGLPFLKLCLNILIRNYIFRDLYLINHVKFGYPTVYLDILTVYLDEYSL